MQSNVKKSVTESAIGFTWLEGQEVTLETLCFAMPEDKSFELDSKRIKPNVHN